MPAVVAKTRDPMLEAAAVLGLTRDELAAVFADADELRRRRRQHAEGGRRSHERAAVKHAEWRAFAEEYQKRRPNANPQRVALATAEHFASDFMTAKRDSARRHVSRVLFGK